MASSQSRVGSVALMTTPATDIGPFYGAPDSEEIRLYIRNTGAVLALISYSSSVLNGAILANGSSDRFPLDVDEDVVFVVAPRQMVYAVGIGAGGQLSFHASPALFGVPVRL
jgi:hypothetical protein